MATESTSGDLVNVVALLGAAVVMVPLFRRLRLGSVLGYLAAGLLIGPFGLKWFTHPQAILHVAELGVVMFLFVIVISLEMRPSRPVARALRVHVAGARRDERRRAASEHRHAFEQRIDSHTHALANSANFARHVARAGRDSRSGRASIHSGDGFQVQRRNALHAVALRKEALMVSRRPFSLCNVLRDPELPHASR